MNTTENNIRETNVLIAGFIGYDLNLFTDEEQTYLYSDWNYIMEAVHKCLEICHDKMLNEWEQGFTDAFLSLDIVQMYDETVKFIKWYNENSAKKEIKNS